MPVWARRGLADPGERAWSTLCRDVRHIDPSRAYCIYVHIPFCASRCGFCDCYSFPLRRHQARTIDQYIGLLEQEMRLWSRLGTLGRRPVSTVHFGGGTPTFLGAEPFHTLVHSLRSQFDSSQAEWALESTTSELTDEMYTALDALGFTRLHVGVQTLQDHVRGSINRREPAETVLTKIERAVKIGWIVSVDLILGLPGQTLDGVLADIQALAAAGVDGFSLYELQLSSRNRQFVQRHGLAERGRLGTYFFLQAASRYLAFLGYRKTLFNHFAREKDTNLYFTFPQRGEDCLALGTIADGVFGEYHYRHPEYKMYRQGVTATFPGLQGGLRRNETENRLRPLEIVLLAGRMPVQRLVDGLGKTQCEELIRQWLASALVEADATGDHLHLTANGSWFAGNMMEQLIQIVRSP